MGDRVSEVRRVRYRDGATFVPVCPRCGRFVKPGVVMFGFDGSVVAGPNATCRRCGEVEMEFEGFFED